MKILENGDVECEKCGGKGRYSNHLFHNICTYCLGTGRLDWIEHIVGKNNLQFKNITIVNRGKKEIFINELSLTIRPGYTFTLSDFFTRSEIMNSVSLFHHLRARDIVILPGEAMFIRKAKLNPGDVVCDLCNGTGIRPRHHHRRQTCRKCRGEGKFDWIENITGHKHRPKSKPALYEVDEEGNFRKLEGATELYGLNK